jgi:acyl-CoA dehydrogenase
MADSDTDALILASTDRLIATFADDRAPAWQAVADLGLPLALVPEDSGGFGIAPDVFVAIVKAFARAAVALPVGETMIANRLRALAGIDIPDTPTLLATRLDSVAWHPDAGHVLVDGRDGPEIRALETLVETGRSGRLDGGVRVAFAPKAEPASVLGAGGSGAILRCGAALRTIQMAGAAQAALSLTIEHVNTRNQFGRPLAKFQAIQQSVAQMAAQVAVIDGAAGIAAEFLAGPLTPSLALAAAKARASEAAGAVAAIAHQAHGAIGFTAEYSLGLHSKALWAWRAEFGGAGYWQDVVGAAALEGDPDRLWAEVIAA